MMANNVDNSDIQGYFHFNSEQYSINDLIGALLTQGIAIHKVGTNLKIGQKIINPISVPQSFSHNNSELTVNQNVIQGLTGQIQRIFGELDKLKDHIGLNVHINSEISSNDNQIFNLNNSIDKTSTSQHKEKNNKWDNFIPSKNFGLSIEENLPSLNEVPIITLGRKKNSSLIEEYNELITTKGITDDDALDSLSSKLFNTANKSINYIDQKSSLRASLQPQTLDKSLAAGIDFSSSSIKKCIQCNSKIPNESQFCSKCGKKI
jgi:hypothetical protein